MEKHLPKTEQESLDLMVSYYGIFTILAFFTERIVDLVEYLLSREKNSYREIEFARGYSKLLTSLVPLHKPCSRTIKYYDRYTLNCIYYDYPITITLKYLVDQIPWHYQTIEYKRPIEKTISHLDKLGV